MTSRFLFGLLAVSVFSSTSIAKNIAPDFVALSHKGEAKCFGYPLSVPLGEADAVLTIGDCVSASGVELLLSDGKKVAAKEVTARLSDLDGVDKDAPSLGVLRFPEGSLVKAAAYVPKSGRLLPGSPLLDDKGEVVGLTESCSVAEKGVQCKSASLKSKEVKDFLAAVEDEIWEDEAVVAGKSHQFCRLLRGLFRGRSRGYSRGYGFRPVRVSYTRVTIVQVVVVVNVRNVYVNNHHHHHHHHHGHGHPHQGGKPGPQQQFQQRPTSYSPPPGPPPKPAYVGVYDRVPNQSVPVTHQVEKEVAESSLALREGRRSEELQVARALPARRLDGQHAQAYALALNAPASKVPGEWIASRDSIRGSSEFLIAANTNASRLPVLGAQYRR